MFEVVEVSLSIFPDSKAALEVKTSIKSRDQTPFICHDFS